MDSWWDLIPLAGLLLLAIIGLAIAYFGAVADVENDDGAQG